MQLKTGTSEYRLPNGSSRPPLQLSSRDFGAVLVAGLLAFALVVGSLLLFPPAKGLPLVAAGTLGAAVGAVFLVVHLVERVHYRASGGGGSKEWRVEGWLFYLFAFLIFSGAMYGLDRLDKSNKPTAQPRASEKGPARYSFGPADAREVDLTVAPGISVELLPSSEALGSRRFEQFDVSPEGAVIVIDDGRVYDMLSGTRLTDESTEARSLAFVGGALAVTTRQGALGYDNGSGFERVADAPWIETGLAPSTSRTTLLLYRERDDGGSGDTSIFAMARGGKPEPVAASARGVRTVAGDLARFYFSNGARLYRVEGGEPELMFAPPDRQPILGIAAAGDGVYFATQHAVYALSGDLVVPLVLGIGGPLRLYGSELYVLAQRQGRVFRLDLRKEG